MLPDKTTRDQEVKDADESCHRRLSAEGAQEDTAATMRQRRRAGHD